MDELPLPAVVVAPGPLSTPPPRRGPLSLVLLSLGTMGASVALFVVTKSPWAVLGFCAAAGFAMAASFRGAVLAARAAGLLLAKKPLGSHELGKGLLALTSGLLFAALGAFLALLTIGSFARGRQLRQRGKILLPRLQKDDRWADVPMDVDVEHPVRFALASHWRENGRTEHASVAAFGRLTLDLLSLGAPPRLIASAHKDALDEIRHAQLCFSLAATLDGASEGPASFPEAASARTLVGQRTLALAQLAVDSLVDGALHEGVSARVVARLIKRCQVPAIRAVLKEIAADEGRHAAHGWDVVHWCVDEGGDTVVHALLGALTTLPLQMSTPLPASAQDGAWEVYGIHGRLLEQEQYAAARDDVVKRVTAMARARVAPVPAAATSSAA